MALHRCHSSSWGHRFEATSGYMQEVEWCLSSVSTMPGLSGAAHRSLGRLLMNSRRTGAPYGTMVVLMIGLVRGFALVYHSEDGFEKWWRWLLKSAQKALSLDCAGESTIHGSYRVVIWINHLKIQLFIAALCINMLSDNQTANQIDCRYPALPSQNGCTQYPCPGAAPPARDRTTYESSG
jgi:hypothetical protein